LSSLAFTNTAGAFTINRTSAFPKLDIRGNITNSSTNTQTINTNLSYPTGTASGSFNIGGVGNITLGGQLISGTAVTVNVVGTGTVSVTGASNSFRGTLVTGTSGVLTTTGTDFGIDGSFTNNGKLISNGGFQIRGAMILANSGTVDIPVPENPGDLAPIGFGDGSSYGGTLNVTLSGTYANPTIADPMSFKLFDAVASPASGGFSTVTGSYSGTSLTFTESPSAPGYWSSNAIVGGPQAGQFLVFEEATGTLMVVPEPSAVVIAGVGVALAGWRMARRRKGGKPSA
jgi:hypothetical protein